MGEHMAWAVLFDLCMAICLSCAHTKHASHPSSHLFTASTILKGICWAAVGNGSHVDMLVWEQWGAVERQAQRYDWSGYRQLFEVVKNFGLSIQVVLSFHSCGGNVGDYAQIPLPKWVLKVGDMFHCM